MTQIDLLYKVAVASVCTALGFVLGASEEVKAATITLAPTIQFGVNTRLIRYSFPISELSPEYDLVFSNAGRDGGRLKTRLAEFNISSFFRAPNTIIRSAVFQDKISRFGESRFVSLGIFGYEGNGTAEASDFDNAVFLSSVDISSSSPSDTTLNFDVTTFVNQLVNSNGNPFAGFAIRILYGVGDLTLGGTDALGRSSLVIETVDTAEPVPEPTTIFGSAIGLCLGGWLKRKKSSQQNKTTPQR